MSDGKGRRARRTRRADDETRELAESATITSAEEDAEEEVDLKKPAAAAAPPAPPETSPLCRALLVLRSLQMATVALVACELVASAAARAHERLARTCVIAIVSHIALELLRSSAAAAPPLKPADARALKQTLSSARRGNVAIVMTLLFVTVTVRLM